MFRSVALGNTARLSAFWPRIVHTTFFPALTGLLLSLQSAPQGLAPQVPKLAKPSLPLRRAMLLAAVSLAGCMVGPNYHRPPAAAPASFKELPGWKLATPDDAISKGVWWQAFGDPLLDRLERQVDVSNQTLKENEAAYRAAQALVDEARANLFPTLGLSAGITRSASGGGYSGATGTTSTTGTSSATSTSPTAGLTSFGSGAGAARTSFSLEGTASWTVDVWGQIRRQVESQVATAQASAATLANARLSAQASLATDYFELRMTDALQRVLDDTVHNDARALAITQNQYAAGTAAQSDVITAKTQLESAQSTAVNTGIARAQYEHAIAVLIGEPPAAMTIAPVRAVPPVPSIPGVMPSELLERRPDIATAERNMKAENALIGAAVAAFYPTIDLSASGGFDGNQLGHLFRAANEVWSLGASASETLFQGGYRTAAVRYARANYDEAVATYRQTVLTAFQGVEDALANERILARQDAIQSQAVTDAARAAQIALNEYQAGTQVYTTVISAQNTLLADQETQINVEQARLTEAVALVEALGGGWRSADLPDKDWLQRRNPLLP